MENSRDRKIDYIEFSATDMQATKDFYGRVFGWTFEDYGAAYTSFTDGRIAGGFRKGDVGVPGGPLASGPLVVIFVDDLPAAEQRIRSAGGTITRETFSFPGGSRFHFTDPSGNELSAWHAE